MSFHPDGPGFTAAPSPGQSPPVERGPEMYQLDPRYEVQDQPHCEIGDLPPVIGDEPTAPTAGDSRRAGAVSSHYPAR